MKGFTHAFLGLALLGSTYLAAIDPPKSENQTPLTQNLSVQNESPLQVNLFHEESSVQPGHPFWVVIHFDIKDGWHTYGKNPGDTGMAARVQWTLPDGFTAEEIQWSTPQSLNSDGTISFGYEKEMILMAKITPPKTPSKEQSLTIAADVNWLACSDSMCLPGSNNIKADISVSDAPQIKTEWASHFEKVRANIPQKMNELIASVDKATIQKQLTTVPSSHEFQGGFAMALLFAFVGGMILNLMPCVLPVISLKIFSFVKMAGENRRLILKHGIAFSVGVILSFWVLAGALLALRAYGESVGWGFQLQEPLFVAILASVMFVLGLSMFGIMELGTSLTSIAGNVKHQSKGLTGSFLSGVLATAVATPCTGPFLGSAVGFAVTLSAPLAMVIFTALGIGMAFPYLLLSAFPSLMRFLPKPGNWMITFKEIMGFFMMATTLWLLWVFAAQTSNIALMALLAAFFFMGVGSWIYGKWGSPIKKKSTRYISHVFSLVLFSLALYTIVSATTAPTTQLSGQEQPHDGWETFSPERIAELQAKGIPVFVDFTAKWCLICQANHAVLSRDQISEKFDQKGVVKMKADWTKNDPIITEALRQFGRNSVPLYVLYGVNEKETPQILPQVLTTDVVLDSLKNYE